MWPFSKSNYALCRTKDCARLNKGYVKRRIKVIGGVEFIVTKCDELVPLSETDFIRITTEDK